jgi:hypothetical protein
VRERDTFRLDPTPGGHWGPGDLVKELHGALSKCNELDPHLIQFMEVGVGRQLRVKDQFLA